MQIVLDQVSCDFHRLRAIDNVSATISRGTLTAVLGANGAGKSTLLRLIRGSLPVSSGRLTVDGCLMKPTRDRLRRHLMFLDEAGRGMLAIDWVGRAIDAYQVERPGLEEEVIEWFERLELIGVAGQRSDAMSRGQSYKVSMIALFVIRPPIWLLDEPFSCGLDAEGIQVLEQQVRHHVAQGGTVMFSSQWPHHANRLATHCMVLDQGRLVWNASIKESIPTEQIERASPSLRSVLNGLGDESKGAIDA